MFFSLSDLFKDSTYDVEEVKYTVENVSASKKYIYMPYTCQRGGFKYYNNLNRDLNATISYQNVQVLCPYNLVALYLGIYGDCYYWKLNSKGEMHTITASFGIEYVPVYYDYVYTQEDLLSDDYYMNVKYDLSKCEIFGGPITLYKDSVITDSYYCRAGLSQMYCIHEDRARIIQRGKDDPW